MKHVATIHVYDSLELVRWTVIVRQYQGYDRPGKTVTLSLNGQYPGVGEPDDRLWLREVLVHIQSHL